VNRVGLLDEAGRLRLLGTGIAGAAFAVVLAVLVVSSFTGASTTVLVTVGVPAAAVGAAIGVVVQLRSWRDEGGYRRSVEVRDWIVDGRVPSHVPAAEWIPAVQAQADHEAAGWGKIVLCTFWSVMTWSLRDQNGTVVTTMLLCFWAAYALWSAAWVIPRARAARALLRNGVATAG
jgi:hypothetical protein